MSSKGTSKSAIGNRPAFFASQLTRRLLPQKLVISSRYIEQSFFFRQTLIVKNFPVSFTNKCLLMRVSQIKDTTFSMRLVPMQTEEVERRINIQINNKAAGRFAKKGTEQIQSNVQYENIRQTFEEMARNGGKMYSINIYIEMYGRTPTLLEEKSKEVMNELQRCYISSLLLIYEQKEGFWGASPIGRDYLSIAQNNMPAKSLAAAYPFSYSSLNDTRGIYIGRTEDGGYVLLDNWERSESRTNSSIVIVGESGFGKSYLIKKIISQAIAMGKTVFVLDPEGEYNTLIRKNKGTILNCASGEFKINVFEIRTFKTRQEDSDGDIDMSLESNRSDKSFFQHLSWLSEFMGVLFPYANGLEISQLMMLVKDMYVANGIDENTNLSKLAPNAYPTFTTLYNYIYDVLKNREQYPFYEDTFSDDVLKKLLHIIRDAYDGSLSPLFNGHTNISNARVLSFNIQELLIGSSARSQAYMFNVMTYIWNRFIRRENQSILVVDEMYLLMNAENLIVAKYLQDFMKRGRKYDASLIVASQRLTDYQDARVYTMASALFNTPTYKFMFNPGELDIERIKSLIGATEGELAYIRKAKKAHCLLKVGDHDRYATAIGTLPYEAEMFGKEGGR